MVVMGVVARGWRTLEGVEILECTENLRVFLPHDDNLSKQSCIPLSRQRRLSL